jgi:thymidine kinase
MFSGKTEELIRRVKRAQIAKQKIQIFKPEIDNRYDDKKVVSHSSLSIEAVPVKDSRDILGRVFDSTRIIAIDEIQFFDENIIDVVSRLARRGCRVICAGLDQDYKGNPFGPIPHLLAIADSVLKVQAICTVCGVAASKTYRKVEKNCHEQVLVGETEMYEARCRSHIDYFEEERGYISAKSSSEDSSSAVIS